MEPELKKECQHKTKAGIKCVFSIQGDDLLYKEENGLVCVYHAPMDARRFSDGKLKADLTLEEKKRFNEYILDFLSQEDSPAKRPTGKLNPSQSAFYDVARALQIVYRGRELGPNEFESKLAVSLASTFRKDRVVPIRDVSRVVFPGPLSVKNKTFDAICLSDCVFCGDVSFEDCTFTGSVDFSGATFRNGLYAFGSTFRKEVWSNRVNFEGPVRFVDVTFGEEIDLSSAKIAHSIHLCRQGHGSSQDNTDRKSSPNIPLSRLSGATFSGMVCLRNRTFDKIEIDRAQFNSLVDLEGAVFPSNIMLSSAKFRRVDSETLPQYARLREIAEKAGDRIGADTFRRRWFQSLLKAKPLSWMTRFVLYGYGLTSSYGTNSTRALASYLAANALALLGYGVAFMISRGRDPSDQEWNAIASLTIRQAINPFELFKVKEALVGIPADHDMLIVAAAHGTLSTVLLGVLIHSIYRQVS
jgi:hypothetical protein